MSARERAAGTRGAALVYAVVSAETEHAVELFVRGQMLLKWPRILTGAGVAVQTAENAMPMRPVTPCAAPRYAPATPERLRGTDLGSRCRLDLPQQKILKGRH